MSSTTPLHSLSSSELPSAVMAIRGGDALRHELSLAVSLCDEDLLALLTGRYSPERTVRVRVSMV
jgi:hypothetical protein